MRRLMMIPLIALAAGRAAAGPLTADEAVKIALQHSSQIVQSDANLLSARSGMWSAYAGVLPQVSAAYSRNGSSTGERTGSSIVGAVVTPSTSTYDAVSYSGSGGLSGSWGVLNLSTWSNWSAARQGMTSARYSQAATRASVALATRTQFYQVVQAMHRRS